MGISSDFKKWLLTIFGTKATSTTPPRDGTVVVIFDHTNQLKMLKTNATFNTGYDYLYKQILAPVDKEFELGARIVYMCFDRGAPINKGMEHARRAKNTVPMETPTDGFKHVICKMQRDNEREYDNRFTTDETIEKWVRKEVNELDPSLLNDYKMISPSDWKSFVSNRYLSMRLVHYLTIRMIGTRGEIHPFLIDAREKSLQKDYNFKLPDYTITPGFDRELCLFGGRFRFPRSDQPNMFKTPDPYLVSFKTVTRIKEEKEGEQYDSLSNSTTSSKYYDINTDVDMKDIDGSNREEEEEDEDVEEWMLSSKVTKSLNTFKDYSKRPHTAEFNNRHPKRVITNTPSSSSPHSVCYETIRTVTPYLHTLDCTQEQLTNLLEGEVSSVFFALGHIKRGENVMIISSDGDTLMMLLLLCPNLIDPLTGLFKATIYVCLIVGGVRQYINVNKLWYNINVIRPCISPLNDSFIYHNDSYEFVSKLVAVGILCGDTDYVKGYCYGINCKTDGLKDAPLVDWGFPLLNDLHSMKTSFSSSTKNSDKTHAGSNTTSVLSTPIPWPMYTFLKYFNTDGGISNFLTIKRSSKQLNIHRSLSKPLYIEVDEEKFINFTKLIYVENYSRSKVYRDIYEVNPPRIEDTREYLYKASKRAPVETMNSKKNQTKTALVAISQGKIKTLKGNWITESALKKHKKERIPPARKIRVLSRHFLWQLLYYCNSFRSNCTLTDPTLLINDLPYYGYIILGNNKCGIAKRVALKNQPPDVKREARLYLEEQKRALFLQEQEEERLLQQQSRF